MSNYDKMKKVVMLYLLLVTLSFAACALADNYATEYGVKFGMTPQEVQNIEMENNHVLKGDFQNTESYQLYYETDIHFYSLKCTRMQYDFGINDRLLFQVYYVSKGGAADFAYVNSFVTKQYGAPVNDINDSGEYSLLYDQVGKDSHIDDAHWIIPDQNLGIDLWYNDYETVFVSFYDTSNPSSYGAPPQFYSDETGISFAYMDGWDAMPLSINPMMIFFTHRRDTHTTVQYMQLDLWENLKEQYEPMGYKREDIGADFLEDDIVSVLMHPTEPQNLRTKQYGSVVFKVFEHQTDNNGASPDLYYCSIAMTVYDGYLHMFQLSSVSKHDESMPAFEALLSTVSFGNIPAASSVSNEVTVNLPRSEQVSIGLGSIVTFGHYEQDNNTANANEPIEWIVIGVEEDRVNLISKYILDLQRYNIQKDNLFWASCNLRMWLNSYFLNASFTFDEQRAMQRWAYIDPDGKQLEDYVYCLSASEVEEIWPAQQDRAALVTDHVFALSDYTNGTKSGQWWLRSECEDNGIVITAQDVYGSGAIGVDNCQSATVGVRPCICVDVSAVDASTSKTSFKGSADKEKSDTLNVNNVEKEDMLEGKEGIHLKEEDAGREKWGFIDKDGHVMIYPEYDFASPFYCDRARVFVGTTSFMGSPENGKFGFVDRNGETVIPITYDYAFDFNQNNQAIVQKEGKYGVIDTEGNVVIPFEYTGISFSSANALYSAYVEDMSNPSVNERCEFYLIDSTGNTKRLGYETPYFEEGCIIVCSPTHDFACAMFSLEGQQLSDYIYEDLKNFSEGVGRYERNGKYGLITTTAEELTAPVYDQIGFVHDGKVLVIYKGKYCLIDLNGNVLQTYKADQIRMYDALQYGVMCALEGDPDRLGDPNNRYYLLAPDGQYISRPYKHTIVFAKKDVFYVLEDGVHYILDPSGKETVLPVECKDIEVYGEDRFFTYKDKKYAFVDLEGNMITQYLWSDVKINEENDMEWICVCY